jgi:hypothetical protein
MKKETKAKLVSLLTAIHDAGLAEMVEANGYFLILKRMVETGADLPHGCGQTPEDIERSAEVYSMIQYWGVGTDEATKRIWQDFCVQWYESLLNRGKTR